MEATTFALVGGAKVPVLVVLLRRTVDKEVDGEARARIRRDRLVLLVCIGGDHVHREGWRGTVL